MNASGPNERDLRATLRRRERLVAPFEDDTELAPSPELDRLILDRARRALREERNGDPQVFRGNTWALPVGIAATILLSFTLVLQLSRPAVDSPLAKALPAADVVQPAIPEAPARAPDAPVSAASMTDDTTATGAVRNDTVRRRAAPAAAYAPAPPADSPARATRPVVADSVADVIAETAAPNITAAGAAAGAATSSAPKTALQEASFARERDSAPDTAATEVLRSDPRRWLAEIDRLRAAGEAAAADRELAALKRRYPDFLVEAAAPP